MATAAITLTVSTIRTESNGTFTVIETTTGEFLTFTAETNWRTEAAALAWIG